MTPNHTTPNTNELGDRVALAAFVVGAVLSSILLCLT